MTSAADPPASPPGPLKDGPNVWRRFVFPAVFVFALFAALWMRRPSGTGSEGSTQTLTGEAFGTTYTVKIVGRAAQTADKDALNRGLGEVIESIDRVFSTYRKDSEISRLNDNLSDAPVALSDALFTVLAAAHDVHLASEGAFDITVGPLVNAWGFGPNKTPAAPSEATLKKARERVGAQHLKLNATAKTLLRARRGMYIDASALAKGFAVDRMAEFLDGKGLSRYMIEVGGEVRTRGTNDRNMAWRIGVVRPERAGAQVPEMFPGAQVPETILGLSGKSMATSGNYRNFRQVGDKFVVHTMDPRSGRSVRHQTASVTVVHDSCMMADAWATALLVLGADKGLDVAKQHGIAALFLEPGPSGFEATRTPPFVPFESEPKRP